MPRIEKHEHVWVITFPEKQFYTAPQVRIMLDLAQMSVNEMYDPQNLVLTFVIPTDRINMNAVEINIKTFFGVVEYVS